MTKITATIAVAIAATTGVLIGGGQTQAFAASPIIDASLSASPPCVVSGYAWRDLNKDDVFTTLDPGIEGVRVDLRTTSGSQPLPGILRQTTTTDSEGFYTFSLPGVECGKFIVDFDENAAGEPWEPFAGESSSLSPANPRTGWTTVQTIDPGQKIDGVDAGWKLKSNYWVWPTFLPFG